ncbi:PAS domain S-box protein [bacterium]|nr:PAS domain S-box protein [bacterium]
MERTPVSTHLLRIVVIALGYLALARLGLVFALPPEKKATAIWPPSGVALASIWFWGARVWPGVWLGALLANLWDHVSWANAAVSAGIACGSTLQALAAGMALQRLNGPEPLGSGNRALRFIWSSMAACLIASSVGCFSLWWSGALNGMAVPRAWQTWWLGDWVGILIFGSFLLVWGSSRARSVHPVAGAKFELPLVLGLSIPVLYGFGVLGPSRPHSPLAYLVLPALVLVTFRFRLLGATAALVLVSLLATGGAAQAGGPFWETDLYLSLGLMQVYLAAVGTTILFLAAVLEENALAREVLQSHSRSLADDVHRRGLELERSADRFRAIFHSQFQFIGLLDPTGIVLEANRTALAASGVEESEVLGRYFWDTGWWSHDPEQQERLRTAVQRVASGSPDRFEASHPSPDGSLIWVDFSLTPFRDSKGEVIYLIPEGRDITQLKQVEENLRIQERHVQGAFKHAPIGKALVSPDGRWMKVNASLCALLGYEEQELLQLTFQSITHPEDLDADLGFVQQMLDGDISTYRMEKRYLHKQGHQIPVLLAVSLVRDSQNRPLYFISQILDISQQKSYESQLQAALREKELMLKEIHHRVKNNLQLVSSMLDLQASHQSDPSVRASFEESRARLRSMALIHERLYRSENLEKVDFVSYMEGLVSYLCQTYQVTQGEVQIETRIGWQSLPLDQAVPCGLMLNELISNSLKHAFRKPVAEPVIRVCLDYSQDGSRRLLVADNGPGLPEGFEASQADSFGMQLIFTLAEQLGGTPAIQAGPGFEFVLTLSD